MSETIKVTVHRSDAWVREQRIATGRNVPEYVSVEVPVAELSLETRRKIIAVAGSYGSIHNVSYDSNFKVLDFQFGRHGRKRLTVDAEVPTAAQVDEAILAAFAAIDADREEDVREKAAKAAAELALAQQWAALPLSQRASAKGVCLCVPSDAPNDYSGPLFPTGIVRYSSNDLKKLVLQAWEEAVTESQRLLDMEQGQQAVANVRILAEFLAQVPQDALRGTAKKIAAAGGPDAVQAVLDKIEDASPIVIFKDNEDD